MIHLSILNFHGKVDIHRTTTKKKQLALWKSYYLFTIYNFLSLTSPHSGYHHDRDLHITIFLLESGIINNNTHIYYPLNTDIGHQVQVKPAQLSCASSQLPGEHTSPATSGCWRLINTRPSTSIILICLWCAW